MTDKIGLAIQDLMWFKDNEFIGLRRNNIRFFKINTNTGKFELIKTINPTKGNNRFIFACFDDMQNFWYSEAISNSVNPTYFNYFNLNYINSYTINKIDIIKEQNDDYIYNNIDIETYIDIATISDFGEIIERDVEIKITGPAKFKTTGTKTLTTKTDNNTYKRIEYIITGSGEIIIKANLIKPLN
jgi:hypothetical protein